MPFFSVIIPTYNRAGLLRKALASISRQQFRDFEIVVVDDGSTDDTEAVVRSSELPVSFLHQTNAGPGAARNLGIAHAQGHYVVFLDSDDQWLPWTLETYRCVIASQEKPTFMSGISLPLKEENADSEMKAGTLDFRHYPSLLVACNDRVPPVGGTPSICLERQALLKIGGFTGRRINGEDIDMWLRLGDSPGFVRILNPPVFLQRVHDGNVTHQIDPAIAGAWYLLEQEQNHVFPGGDYCRWARRRIICGTVRSVSLGCLNHGRAGEAFRLYRASFLWNFALGNWKYLAGFPLVACRHKSR